MKHTAPLPPVFGVIAEFAESDDLVAAIRHARAAGFTRMEAYTPYPSHEVTEALGHKNRLPLIVLLGGIVGALAGFYMQYWMSAVDYPIDVGGRPYNSWPSFLVITFEMTILCAAGAAVLGMLALNGLPRPHHPVFSVEGFELASRNRFFLMIIHYDPHFDRDRAWRTLSETSPLSLQEVPHA